MRVDASRWRPGRAGRRGEGPDRPTREPVLLRQVPGDSAVHRLWAGTKLLAVAVVAVVLSAEPSWAVIGLFAALLGVTAVLAHIPRGAVPLPPRWFWILMLLGAVLTLASGGRPEVTVGGGHVGLGDLELYVRFTCLAAEVLWASATVAWTTPLGEVAPALARLWRPLRWVRLPVDEWAVTVALSIRSLPLLVDELRVLLAARRLRAHPDRRRSVDDLLEDLIDVSTAALAAAIRRAGEMGEAITARGGMTLGGAPRRPLRRADAAALATVTVVAAAGIALSIV